MALALTGTTRGVLASRARAHSTREPCGSASATRVFIPANWAATARLAVTVDLPVPPFCATTAMIFIGPGIG